jgi:hypothetical protein
MSRGFFAQEWNREDRFMTDRVTGWLAVLAGAGAVLAVMTALSAPADSNREPIAGTGGAAERVGDGRTRGRRRVL